MLGKLQKKEGSKLINKIRAIEKWAMNGLKNRARSSKGYGLIEYKQIILFEEEFFMK